MRSWLSAVVLLAALGAGCRGSSSRGGLEPNQSGAAPTITIADAASSPAGRGRTGPAALPNPLISRGKPVFATSLARFAHPQAIDDGVYNTFEGTWSAGMPSAAQPAMIAIRIGAGPRRVMVDWSAGGNYNYTDTEYGSPGSYRIETSSDSTDGADGTWKDGAINTHCTVHAQAHVIDFVGQSWVRMVITGAPPKSPNGVQLDEIDVYDVSAGVSDSWFFFGDSITAGTFNRTTPSHQPSFAEVVHERYPSFFPAMINGGIGGDRAEHAAGHIDSWLALNPDMRFWAIGLGTNDAAGSNSDTSSFRHHLSTVIAKVKAAGHIPIVARIPFCSDGGHDTIPKFNQVIAELTSEEGLLPGPDLYGWFMTHPEQLRDGIHPTDVGVVAINRLWADAVAGLYAR
jgi:acyl-CoA thioesterase-1